MNASWFRSKPYDKSEAYDIARQLDVESNSLPCLVLISPANLSEKLVLPIREVSPEYFRKLFSTLEKLVKSIGSEKLRQREASSQVFDYLKLNFSEIVDFLEKYASKEENDSKKYILKGENIFVSIEPVNISNVGNTMTEEYKTKFDMSNAKIGNVADTVQGNQQSIQHNYGSQEKQDLASAAAEIQRLLQQLEKSNLAATQAEKQAFVTAAIAPEHRSRIVSALQAGGEKALEEFLKNPYVNVAVA